MSKSFEITLNRRPDELIGIARNTALRHGIRFEGDNQSGQFAGHGIEGSYTVLDQILFLQIHEKPFLMPWTLVESTLKKYFGQL